MNLLERVAAQFYAQAQAYADKPGSLYDGLSESMQELGELFDPTHERWYSPLILYAIGFLGLVFLMLTRVLF